MTINPAKIAAELQLSRSTVYRVLHNSQSVSAAARAKVTAYLTDHSLSSALSDQTAYSIIAAIPSIPTAFWQQAYDGAVAAAAEYPELKIKFIRYSGRRIESETLRVIDCIRHLTSQAALLVPLELPSVRHAIEALASTRNVIIYNDHLDFTGCQGSYCGDVRGEAKKAAEIISGFPLKQKRVLIMTIDGSGNNSSLRCEVFKHCVSVDQTIELVGEIVHTDESPLGTAYLARELHRLKKSFNCVYVSDGFFYDACTALRKADLLSSLYVVGHEPDKSVLKLFASGMKGAYIAQNVRRQAYDALRAAAEQLLHGTMPPEMPEDAFTYQIYL